MSRPWLIIACLGCCWVGFGVHAGVDEPSIRGKTLTEWLSLWGGNKYEEQQEATEAIIALGARAAPRLVAIIDESGKHARRAGMALGKMGQGATVRVLPDLVRILENRDHGGRLSAMFALGDMASWAGDELLPVFAKIIRDGTDEESLRSRCVSALQSMGDPGRTLLDELAQSEDLVIRERARGAIGSLLGKSSEEEQQAYYLHLVEEDPYDPHVPDYLMRVHGAANATMIGRREHPIVAKVKQLQRERLDTDPSPELALTLAEIILGQLWGTDLQWAAPTDMSRGRSLRQDPAACYPELRSVLEKGFAAAERESEVWNQLGVGLAKLHLLGGDWQAMNDVLGTLGLPTIAAKDRPWLSAPPMEWDADLAKNWAPCDASLREGNCGLLVNVRKGDGGLAGVHILLKPDPTAGQRFGTMRTGLPVDTLFAGTQPIDRKRWGSFGYRADDRPKTRYGVTNAAGEVLFERLPNEPMKIEVLVPTANFPEPGTEWDLWMEVAQGRWLRAERAGGPGIVGVDPIGKVSLVEGSIAAYPKLHVSPRREFEFGDWSSVDPKSLVLRWSTVEAAETYRVRFAVAGLSQHAGFQELPDIAVGEVDTSGTEWAIGERGVGGVRLVPGNLYKVSVEARARDGRPVGRWGTTTLWVPWSHRAAKAPYVDPVRQDESRIAPVEHDMWFRTPSMRNRVDDYVAKHGDAFELEYARLAKAWWRWHDGDVAGARGELVALQKKLVPGNVVRETAIWFIGEIDSEGQPPKRLNFVAKPGPPEKK